MRNPFEVIRLKEQEIARVKEEIEALRLAAKLLSEDTSTGNGEMDLRRVIDMK